MGKSTWNGSPQSWVFLCGLIFSSSGCFSIQTQLYHQKNVTLWHTVNVSAAVANKRDSANTTCHAVASACNLSPGDCSGNPLNMNHMNEANFQIWLHMVWSALPRETHDNQPRKSYMDFVNEHNEALRKIFNSLTNYKGYVQKPIQFGATD